MKTVIKQEPVSINKCLNHAIALLFVISLALSIIIIPASAVETDKQKLIDDAVAKIMEQITPDMTDYQKTRIMYSWMTRNVSYNWSGFFGVTDAKSTVYNALVEGTAVCEGYARGFMRLLDEVGIENRFLSSRKMNHAWTLVKLNGNWYHCDPTWDEGGGRRYFLLSDDAMGKDHNWERDKYPSTPKVSFFGTDERNAFAMKNTSAFYYDATKKSVVKFDTATGELESIFTLPAEGMTRIEETRDYTYVYKSVGDDGVCSLRVSENYLTISYEYSKFERDGKIDDRSKYIYSGIMPDKRSLLYFYSFKDGTLTRCVVPGDYVCVTGDYAFFSTRDSSFSKDKRTSFDARGYGINFDDLVFESESVKSFHIDVFNIATGEFVMTKKLILGPDTIYGFVNYGGISYNNKVYFHSRFDIYCYDTVKNTFTKLKRPDGVIVDNRNNFDEHRVISSIAIVERKGKTYLKWQLTRIPYGGDPIPPKMRQIF